MNIKCLYCGETKQKSKFNKEHVIPKSFGTFGTQTPTLQIVCENCNQYFGDTIDRELSRSGLNVHKFLSGNKKTFESSKDFKNQSLTISEGPFMGLPVMLSRKNPKLITPPLHYDFGLRKENGKYDWYSVKTLPTKEEVSSHPTHSEWIWILKSEKKDEIIQVFQREYNIILDNKFQDHQIKSAYVDSTFELNEMMLRSLYKIAYNFLAYTYVNSSYSYLLYDRCFEPIKRYIRLGEKPQWNIHPIIKYINKEEPGKSGLKHVLTFEIHGNGIVSASVTLYNEYQFQLILENGGYPGIVGWRFGQLFCSHSKQVINLERSHRMYGLNLIMAP